MLSHRRLVFHGGVSGWVLLALSVFVIGCFSNSGDTPLDTSPATTTLKKATVYPLAGTVSIDGQPFTPANPEQTLVVMLNDPKNPDVPMTNRHYVIVQPGGTFAFHSYTKDDGVLPGTYVLTFGMFQNTRKVGLKGPDKLKNRYNDPDKNAESPEFKIHHQAPGKSDYHFAFKVAGEEEVKPGPHALTELIYERRR